MLQFQLRTMLAMAALVAVFCSGYQYAETLHHPAAEMFYFLASEGSLALLVVLVWGMRWRGALWGLPLIPVLLLVLNQAIFRTVATNWIPYPFVFGVAVFAPAAILCSIYLIRQDRQPARIETRRGWLTCTRWLSWLSLYLATAASGATVRFWL